nr:hypothetical protein [Prolixibacteraceae bacterium]
MKHIPHIFLLALTAMMACDPDDPGNRASGILIGIETGMDLVYHDTLLAGGYHNTRSLDLDLNNDSLSDIRLISDIWGSPGLGQNPCSKIWCLHSGIRFCGYETSDTVFLNRTYLVDQQPENVVVYETYTHTCQRIDSADSILSVSDGVFKILPMCRGDELRRSDWFKADSITLVDDLYGWPYTISELGGDTLLYHGTCFYFNCSNFPEEEVTYIGLILEHGGQQQLGWI